MGIWKPVHGFEGIYEVSSAGQIKRCGLPRKGAVIGRCLKPWLSQAGYFVIYLCSEAGSRHAKTVHKVVARAFLGPVPKGHNVNHKNGTKTDNSASNLEYVLPRTNTHHHLNQGFSARKYSKLKLTKEKAEKIRRWAKTWRREDLAAYFGVHLRTIHSVIGRKSWTS